jgi:hypothetical protein
MMGNQSFDRCAFTVGEAAEVAHTKILSAYNSVGDTRSRLVVSRLSRCVLIGSVRVQGLDGTPCSLDCKKTCRDFVPRHILETMTSLGRDYVPQIRCTKQIAPGPQSSSVLQLLLLS